MGIANWCRNNFTTEYNRKLLDVTSIFSAETIAVNILKYINNSELSDFIFFSDSKSVLSALLNMKELKH